MKRILSMLLALAMLVLSISLVACSKNNPEVAETVATTTGTEDTEDASKRLDLPEDLNYGGADFTILMGSSTIADHCVETTTESDNIDMSLYQRDMYVKDRLGVNIKYEEAEGGYAGRDTFTNQVYNAVLGGQKEYDLLGCYSMVAPNLTLKNVLYDMRTLDYVDFGKAWYPQFMVEASTINNKTYFMSGDISINTLYQMQGIVFSAIQLEVNGMSEDDLYQMVYDGKWTLENWLTMCEDLARETGGDGVWDEKDYYPIVVGDGPWLDSFYFSSGLTLINEAPDGKLEVSQDVNDEKVLSIYSAFYDAVNTYRSAFVKNGNSEKKIVNSECIFAVTTMAQFRTTYVDAKEQFRVLPFPKYDETEATYRTLLGMGHKQYCIPNDIDDANRSAAVLEALSYSAYTYVTPVVFEETMKLRYSENGDVSKMFDYLREGCIFDVGSLFYMQFSANGYKDPHSMFRNAILNSTSNWTSNYMNNYATGLVAVTRTLNEYYSK